MATWIYIIIGAAMTVIALEFFLVFRNRRETKQWSKVQEKASMDKAVDALREEMHQIQERKEEGQVIDRIMENSERIMRDEPKSIPAVPAGPYTGPLIGMAWKLFVMIGQATCWIIMPLVALAFAQWFTQGMALDGHGALAAVATYIVAAVAGIKGAAQASRQIGEFRGIRI